MTGPFAPAERALALVRTALALARAAVWNTEERRPRAPLRLVGHGALVLAGVVALALGLAVVRGPTPLASLSPLGTLAVNAAVLGGAVVPATLLAARLLDRRSLASLGLGVDRAWWRDLGAGLALGAGLQAGVFLTSLAAGWTTVRAVGAGRGAGAAGVAGGVAGLAAVLLAGAALMAWVGLYEELLFRGYHLVNVAEGMVALPGATPRRATLSAAALTSLSFGAVHGANPNATAVSTALVTVYGVYLAAGFLVTGDLALPVGFHAAWNYAQAFVFGFPVSGFAVEASLLSTTTAGPEPLTGGSFGPEAGLLGLGWVLASLPALWWWVRRTRGAVCLQASIAGHQDRGTESQ